MKASSEDPKGDGGHDTLHCPEAPTTREEKRSKLDYFVFMELVVFLHNFSTAFVYLTSQTLMIEKTCKVNFDYPDHICNDLSTYENEEAEVQVVVSEFLMWRSFFETGIKIISVPLIGWWSDRWGRKWPLIYFLACQGLYCLVLLVNGAFSSWSLEPILAGSVFYGMSGGTQAILMLAFSFMAYRTSTAKRTLRVSILDGFYYLGPPFGLAIAAPLFDAGGYIGTFGLGAIVYVIAGIYVLFVFPSGEVAEQEKLDWREDCGVEKVTTAFYVTFQPRPNRIRRHILLLIFTMLLDSFVIYGESNVQYLFTQRALDWEYENFSRWSSLTSLLTVIGALGIVALIEYFYPIHDMFIGIIGALSRTFERILYACAVSPEVDWLMFAGAFLGTCAPLVPIAIRSHLSKLALSDVGQVYAVMAVGQTLLPFLSSPLYTSLYQASIDVYPGSFYILSAFVCFMMAVVFLIVYFSLKRTNKKTAESSRIAEK